jgi:uracil-DNA glycosylase family 4
MSIPCPTTTRFNGVQPPAGCRLCPRLAAFRDANRKAYPGWHNDPVPSFGGLDARLLIVGLAPGLKGANRTGRPFTGDYAGDLLYATLLKCGLAQGHYGQSPSDGLTLAQCRITNAVRCVPPQNKPSPEEARTCGAFLRDEIISLRNMKIILALGRIAHEASLDAMGLRRKDFAFAHGALHALPDGKFLTDSYHCSRYNTQTKRLTEEMFQSVVQRAADLARG